MDVMIFGRAFLVGLLVFITAFIRPVAAQTTAATNNPQADASLLEAAETGDVAKVRILLETGANPRTCSKLGWPVSTLAACRGHTEVVRLLYERDRLTADQTAPGDWTPLEEAAIHNHLETVRFLLSCHVRPQTANDEQLTAEDYAQGRGYTDIVAALREAAGEPPEPNSDPDEDNPLTAAAAAGDVVTLAKLLDQGRSVETCNAGGRTVLICATKYRQAEAVRMLIGRHANPNNLSHRGNSPLDFAVRNGDEPIVRFLLEAGADPNGFRAYDLLGDNHSPMFIAFEAGRLDLVKLLLAHGARVDDLNNVGTTALMQAACYPHVDVLAFLVEHGQSVNASNRYGYSALMCAASSGCDENIRFLLGKGADLHAKTKNRTRNHRLDQPYNALEAATLEGQPFAMEILLDAGATPAEAESKFTKELFVGIDGSDYELVQAALRKGASPNDLGAGNRLPLQTAVLIGDPGIVALLLKAGADVNKTPEDLPDVTVLHNATSRLDFVNANPNRIKDPRAKEKSVRIIEMIRQAQASR